MPKHFLTLESSLRALKMGEMTSRCSESRSVRTLKAPMLGSTLENNEMGYLTVVANDKP